MLTGKQEPEVRSSTIAFLRRRREGGSERALAATALAATALADAESYPIWESLVIQYRVSGKPVHDARLVAAMKVHGLTSILTFDRTGFSRYGGIEVVHPADAAA